MIAIISDIHSNLEALNAVIDECKKYKIERIFCCGDIIGYGPNPNECIKLLKDKNVVSVIGNHDAVVFDETNFNWFNENAKEAILINKKLINAENQNYLKTLPKSTTQNEHLLVHGSPVDPTYEYLFLPSSLGVNIKYMKQAICFCGHTHIPLLYSKSIDNKTEIYYPKNNFSIKLEKDKKYIINVGSVGQPRDLDNRACFVIFDIKNNIIQFKRISYNFYLTQ